MLVMSEAAHFRVFETPASTANEIVIAANEIPEVDEFPASPYSAAITNFVSTFIYDLEIAPTPNEEDAAAIQKLGWSLKASSFRIWARETFPSIAEFFEAPGTYPGRRVCSIHNKLALPVLFNLHDLILDEVQMPSVLFCDQKLGNEYLNTFKELNRIWDKEYCNLTPIPGAKLLHRPLENYPLYQESHCAGCCLRRILSDYNIIAVLLIAVRFRELEKNARERELTDYLEASWEVLAGKLPLLFGSREDAMRARDKLELAAIQLSERSKVLENGRVGRIKM